MKRPLAVAALGLALGLAGSADALRHGSFHHGPSGGHHPFYGHHPFFHSHGGSRFFFDGGFFFDPFFPYYYSPYYYDPYYDAPYPVYPPPDIGAEGGPPPDVGAEGGPPPEEEGEPRAENAPPSSEETESERASYGLVQLQGVPDGAAVDLDGRFWLTAKGLDQRWLAMPDGEHTLAVRVRGSEPVERRVEVKPGKTSVVRFGPFRHQTG